MKKQKRYLYLGDDETKVVLHSLINLKNKLIQQGRYTDCVDDLIIKVTSARTKKIKIAYMVLELSRLFFFKSRRFFHTYGKLP